MNDEISTNLKNRKSINERDEFINDAISASLYLLLSK